MSRKNNDRRSIRKSDRMLYVHSCTRRRIADDAIKALASWTKLRAERTKNNLDFFQATYCGILARAPPMAEIVNELFLFEIYKIGK